MYKGGQKTAFIYKNLCNLTCLNFSSLQSTLHVMRCTYQDVFSTAQNSFWSHWFWCLLCFCYFLFHLFHTSKMFPFEDFFNWRKQTNKQKLTWGEIRWIGRVGHGGGSCCFGSKTAKHSAQGGQVCLQISHHEMGKCVESLQKKNHWSRMQPLTTTPAGTLIQMGS